MGISGLSFNAKHSGTFKAGVPNAKHANVWKPAKEWWERKANVWTRVWSALSAKVVGSFVQINGTGNNVYDRATLSLVVTPSATPTAYAWEYADSGGALFMVGGATSPTFVLRAPTYDYTLPTTEFSVTVWCTATIGGVPVRSPNRTLTYTVGGFV